MSITPLHRAVMGKKSSDKIQTLLKSLSKIEINAMYPYSHNTALHFALFEPPGNLDTIKLLLKYGADVNKINVKGQTPLHISVQNNMSIEVIKELLNNEANLNAKDCHNLSPLQVVLSNHENNFSIIKELLTNGANINDRNDDGQTLVHMAIQSGKKFDVIQLLIKYGVDVNARDNNHSSALHAALSSKCIQSIGNLTPVQGIIKREIDFDIINVLLRYGADANAEDKFHSTPLYVALSNTSHNLDIIRILFQYGATVNYVKTPMPYLNLAVGYRKPISILQELIRQGAKVNNKRFPIAPLETALFIIPFNLGIIKELLNHGASVHEQMTSNCIMKLIAKRMLSLELLGEFTKYALVEYPNHKKCILCDILYSSCALSKEYRAEIHKMKTFFVLDQLTVYDFVVNKYDYDKLYMRELDELSKFIDLDGIMQKEFPLYYDIILNIIETRSYLLQKLHDCSVCIVTDEHNCNVITLNSDCVDEIGKYLPRNDLRNFLKAIVLNELP